MMRKEYMQLKISFEIVREISEIWLQVKDTLTDDTPKERGGK